MKTGHSWELPGPISVCAGSLRRKNQKIPAPPQQLGSTQICFSFVLIYVCCSKNKRKLRFSLSVSTKDAEALLAWCPFESRGTPRTPRAAFALTLRLGIFGAKARVAPQLAKRISAPFRPWLSSRDRENTQQNELLVDPLVSLPSISILNPKILLLSRKPPLKPQGKRIRFSKRTMVEKNGESTLIDFSAQGKDQKQNEGCRFTL